MVYLVIIALSTYRVARWRGQGGSKTERRSRCRRRGSISTCAAAAVTIVIGHHVVAVIIADARSLTVVVVPILTSLPVAIRDLARVCTRLACMGGWGDGCGGNGCVTVARLWICMCVFVPVCVRAHERARGGAGACARALTSAGLQIPLVCGLRIVDCGCVQVVSGWVGVLTSATLSSCG